LARPLGSKGSAFDRAVKQSNNQVLLLGSTGCKILEALGAGNMARDAAKIAECSKQNVSYWTNKLLTMGALKIQCRDVYTTYSLTPFGQTILTGSERRCREVVGIEDYGVKFLVVESEKVRIDWRKLGCPRNWEKLSVKIGGVRVVRTSRHVIIHPGKLLGFDMMELKVEAGRIIERVKSVLETRFGMVLSDHGVPLRKPIFERYTREAAELAKYGSFNLKDPDGQTVGSINCSPPSRKPHEEYIEEVANEHMLLPRRLVQLEQMVDRLEASMSKLASVLERIFDLEDTSPKPVEEKRSMQDYVA